jgi:NAD(P)H-hydrate epimerase
VTDGHERFENSTGNPGMATGGTGDVLTGVTTALLGQGLSAFDAACLAVYVHGRAGDLAAQDLGQVAMIASDLLNYLPAAMKEVS